MIISMPIKTSSHDAALAPLFGNAKFFAFATDTAQIDVVQMEQLGGKVRDAGEFQILTLGEGVADLDGTVVVQPYDVTGAGLDCLLAITGHEGDGIGDVHILADAHVAHLHALGVSP